MLLCQHHHCTLGLRIKSCDSYPQNEKNNNQKPVAYEDSVKVEKETNLLLAHFAHLLL